ncbi:helix-turn-helix domain-containing protein [Guggenheimella bovis]
MNIDAIKVFRKKKGISVETVAKHVGVSTSTMYRYENGDIQKIPVDNFKLIAEVLETTPEYLLNWSKSEKPQTMLHLKAPRQATKEELKKIEDYIQELLKK